MLLSSQAKKGLIVAIAVVVAGFFCATGCDDAAVMNLSSPNVKHITQAEFADEVTRSTLPVVIEFYATWCGPCKELGPLIEKVAVNYVGKIKFVKVNVDESPGLAQNYHVDVLPMTLLFKDDKLADQLVGIPAEADLKSKLDALIAPK